MIAIDNLTVSFGGVRAIDGLSLQIAEDVVGVIGPNGAGKTTLINVLSGFVTPAEGCITVHEHDLLSLKPHERARWGLARSFQKVQTVPDLSVEGHVRTALDSQRLPERDKQTIIEKLLEFTGLAGLQSRPGRSLDTRQRRMTEIARCLAASPKIVLLDEPGGGLSESEVDELRDLISSIHREFGAMVVLIDHDVELIKAVCSHTAVLDFGKLIIYGETGKVLQDEKVRTAYLGGSL